MSQSIMHKNICDLSVDSHILKLFKEIDLVSGHLLEAYMTEKDLIINYLTEFHRGKPLSKGRIDKITDHETSYLSKRIGKLKGTDLYDLCQEIARTKSDDYESIDNKTLYVFLNKAFNASKKKKQEKAASALGYY